MKGILKMIFKLVMLAAAAALAVWGALRLMEYRRISSYVPYDGIVKSVSYSSAGGMDGGSLEITAVNTDKGYVLVGMEEKKTWNGRIVKKTFKADPALLFEVEELVNGYGALEWDELPVSEFVVLDAPTVSVAVELTDGTCRRFYSYQAFPEGCGDLLFCVRQILEKYAYGR